MDLATLKNRKKGEYIQDFVQCSIVATTATISYYKAKGGMTSMIKIILMDESDHIAGLVYSPCLLPILQEAAKKQKGIKLKNFRNSTENNPLITISENTFILITESPYSLHAERIQASRRDMFAAITTIEAALACPPKTRVSVQDTITRVSLSMQWSLSCDTST